MNSIIKKIIIVVTLLFTFFLVLCTGGPYEIKSRFNANEKIWLDTYKINDTIIFLCAVTGKKDSIIIKERYYYSPFTKIPIAEDFRWLSGNHNYYAIGGFDMIILHDEKKYDGGFIIKKTSSNENIAAESSIWIFNDYYDLKVSLDSVQHLQLNKAIEECIVFKSFKRNNNIRNSNCLIGNVDSVTWSKNKGLLQYSVDGYKYISKHLLRRKSK